MRIAEHREHQYFERTLQHRVYPALRLSEGRLHIVLVGRRLYLPSTLGVSQRGLTASLRLLECRVCRAASFLRRYTRYGRFFGSGA